MKKTPLHAAHLDHKAKMGEFAGYDMPLYYGLGVMKEHEWVRSSCGLFDVSHMGQVMVQGPGALDLVQKLTPSSFEKLPEAKTRYTVLLNEEGGIIDDLMITRAWEDAFHFVLNAGCKDKDIAWIKSHLSESDELTHFDDWALLALQGQKAENVVKEVLGYDLSDLPYMGVWARDDMMMFISRLGYTGEDGFEISLQGKEASGLWEKLVAHEAVEPIGLAARDSLRLEMGYCLYGHDIDEQTSPVEADLSWVIGKNADGYLGCERVKGELANGVDRKRVGIRLLDKGVAREGAGIRNEADEEIGTLTSGGFSPSLKESIGQGYLDSQFAEKGQKVFVNVRGRNIAAEVSAMPFMSPRTKSMKKKAA